MSYFRKSSALLVCITNVVTYPISYWTSGDYFEILLVGSIKPAAIGVLDGFKKCCLLIANRLTELEVGTLIIGLIPFLQNPSSISVKDIGMRVRATSVD